MTSDFMDEGHFSPWSLELREAVVSVQAALASIAFNKSVAQSSAFIEGRRDGIVVEAGHYAVCQKGFS